MVSTEATQAPQRAAPGQLEDGWTPTPGIALLAGESREGRPSRLQAAKDEKHPISKYSALNPSFPFYKDSQTLFCILYAKYFMHGVYSGRM